jgi:hypothetical protein
MSSDYLIAGGFGDVLEIETDPNVIYPEHAGNWPVPDLSLADTPFTIDVKLPDGTWTTWTTSTYSGTKILYTFASGDRDDPGTYTIAVDLKKTGVYDIPGYRDEIIVYTKGTDPLQN